MIGKSLLNLCNNITELFFFQYIISNRRGSKLRYDGDFGNNMFRSVLRFHHRHQEWVDNMHRLLPHFLSLFDILRVGLC